MTSKITLTAKQTITEELNRMMSYDLPQATAALAEAREHGDLSENAEFDIAKLDLYKVQNRIAEIQNILENAQIIEIDGYHSYVTLGATVTVKDLDTNEIETFTFVDKAQMDPLENFLSTDCPLYKAIKGLREGDEAVVYANKVNRLSIVSII